MHARGFAKVFKPSFGNLPDDFGANTAARWRFVYDQQATGFLYRAEDGVHVERDERAGIDHFHADLRVQRDSAA